MKQNRATSKIIGIVLVCLMLGAMFGGLPNAANAAMVPPHIYIVPLDYSTIQAAVDAASPGDTIIVYPGTYTENVDVNKDHLTIQSESGAETTIVQAANPDDHVFEVTVDYVNINGFTATAARGHGVGIYLENVSYCNISNNIVSENQKGVRLDSSNNNSIVNNNISNNGYGVYLEFSSQNTLADNILNSNSAGLFVNSSSNNKLTGNSMFNNLMFNFGLEGHSDSDFNNDIDTTNLVDGKPIYYIKGASRITLDSTTNAGTIYCIHCDTVTIKNLTLINNYAGVYFWGTKNSRIENVNASHNMDGISLHYCSNNNTVKNNDILHNARGICLFSSCDNILTGNNALNNAMGICMYAGSYRNSVVNNNVCNNDRGIHLYGAASNKFNSNNISSNKFGIHLDTSSDNKIYLNNFIDNDENVSSTESTNIWSSPEEITYTYNGKTYTNYLGNYWSDYAGSDADGDGIGDILYSINSDKDNYPLMEPFENYVTGAVAELEVYAYEASSSWARDATTDLPICAKVIVYAISNKGTEEATNVQISINIGGNPFLQDTTPTISVGESYIGGFSTTINYDSSEYVEITASTAGSSDTYGFFVEATLPRAAGYMTWQEQIGPLVKLFITPNDKVVKSTLEIILSSYPSTLPDWVAIRDWVGFFVAYASDTDEYGVDEYFQLPRETIQNLFGDCEDFAMLLVSLLRADGWGPDEVYVVAGKNPEDQSHAWVILKTDTLGWLTIEPRFGILGTFVGDYLVLRDFEPVCIFNDEQFVGPFVIRAHSPVDIVVTDPDGLVVSKQLNEIPGAWYSEIDLDGYGDVDDQVVILDRKIGDYTIILIPEPDASPADTYTLHVSANGVATTLAENVPISDIPNQGYIARSTETEVIQIIPATIDFDPDTLNVKSKGKYVTVYIELPPGYDIGQIDVSSITLNGVVPALTKPTKVDDYDGDGIPDLMVKFDRAAVQEMLTQGDRVEITISGEVAGIDFEGDDTIRVIDR